MIPLLVLVVALLGLGYFAYDRMHDAGTTPRSTTTQSARPGATTTTPPATTPAQPTTPKQP